MNYATKYLRFILALCLCFLISCNHNGNKLNTEKSFAAQSFIYDNRPLYSKSNFPVGVAIKVRDLQYTPSYKSGVVPALKQFNTITEEHCMFMYNIHPDENRFVWESDGSCDLEYLKNFCLRNNIKINAHMLLWDKSDKIPQWMKNFRGNKYEWEQMLKNHIQTIVRYFKGIAVSWNVVNEAFDDDGNFKNSIFRKNIGNDYVAKCFIWAREADPNVKLYYNDYFCRNWPGYEQLGNKLKSVLNMARNFKKHNIPIDGIGMQMHISYEKPSLKYIEYVIDSITREGLAVRFSELDISLNPKKYGDNSYNLRQLIGKIEKLKLLQKERVKSLVRIYKKIPSQYQGGITFWGVSDVDSWLRYKEGRNPHYRMDWPLLFDERYNPKPAFYGFIEALEGY